jgi:hypothetical protein
MHCQVFVYQVADPRFKRLNWTKFVIVVWIDTKLDALLAAWCTVGSHHRIAPMRARPNV